MNNFFQTYDLISEIEKEVGRAKHVIQLMIDKHDLFIVSSAIAQVIARQISVEIIVVSDNQDKSMKLVNLSKSLLDNGAQLYWICDSDLYLKEDYFMIVDKSYIVYRNDQEILSGDGFLRRKNDYFNSIAIAENRLNLLSGDIEIDFFYNKNIVEFNEEIEIYWKVKNAHSIEISPDVGKVDSEGQLNMRLDSDSKISLIATNRDSEKRRSLFIRVEDEARLKYVVETFDSQLNDFVEIEPVEALDFHYAVFTGQLVRLSWEIRGNGKLIESNLGSLALKDSHEFVADQEINFVFIYNSINARLSDKITFHCFEYSSPKIESSMQNQESTTLWKGVLNRLAGVWR